MRWQMAEAKALSRIPDAASFFSLHSNCTYVSQYHKWMYRQPQWQGQTHQSALNMVWPRRSKKVGIQDALLRGARGKGGARQEQTHLDTSQEQRNHQSGTGLD
jgi:hypothetical protein